MHATSTRSHHRSPWSTALRLVIPLALLLGAACGDDDDNGGTATPGDQTSTTSAGQTSDEPLGTVRVGMSPTLNGLPVMVGIAEEIFLKHGVEVEATIIGDGGAIAAAVAGGDVDLGLISSQTSITNLEGGGTVQAVALTVSDATTVTQDQNYGIVSGDPAVTELAQLEGKKMAVPDSVTLNTYARAALEQSGVDPDSVEILAVDGIPDTKPALSAGASAAVVTEPFITELLRTVDGSSLLIRGGDIVANRIYVVGEQDYLAENAELVEPFVLALAEASQIIRQDPSTAAAATTSFIPGLDLSIVEEALTNVNYDPRYSDFISQAFDADTQFLIDQGEIEAGVPFEDAFDPTFIEAIMADQPELFDDLPALS